MAADPPPAAEGPGRQVRALVVDDERVNREVIVASLRVAGYETVAVEDGLAAWEVLDADPGGFEVVLLDRRMPRMDGMALLGRLKADIRLRDIPVIMQTAYARPEDVIDGVQAGVYYYLAKPLNRQLMLSVVAAAVGDRLRFLRLQADLAKSTSSLGLLDEGSFSFRTIAEGTLLAVALARACPRSNFLVVGLSELFTNAVEHGNLGIATEEKERLLLERRLTKEIEARQDTPANRDKRVRVRFERRPGEIRITVRDEGRGFDWRAFVDLEPSRAFRAYGRGIAMARRLCFDAIEYRDPGNEVVCVIRDRGDPLVPPVAEIVSPPPFPVAPDRAEVPPSRPPDPEDVRLARGMQAELMPQLDRLARIGRATGLRLSAFHEFSSDFGGDLWGIDLLDRDRVAVWLADFSGHGLSAALNTFRLHALVSNFTEALERPADFLAELNRCLVGALPVGQYATMLYGVVDLSARLFRYAAAAAPPPVAVESGTLTTGIGDGAGLPLGVARWSVYKEREMAFGPGSALLLASDALSEQPCEDGRRLGTAGVVDLVRRAVVHGAGGGCDVESVLAPFLSEVARPLRDDLTALCCFWPE